MSHFNTEQYYDVTNVDLNLLVRTAYNLSVPQGLGFLHSTPANMTKEAADEVLEKFEESDGLAVAMDYVKGRAVKLSVYSEDGKRWIYKHPWFDHTDETYDAFLEQIGIERDLKVGT